jgi:hypothetical protein
LGPTGPGESFCTLRDLYRHGRASTSLSVARPLSIESAARRGRRSHVSHRTRRVASPYMGMLNKRNAVLGWTAWQVGKRVMKRKARGAVPRRADDTRRPNKGVVAAVLAAIGGALLFWRSRRDDESQ